MTFEDDVDATGRYKSNPYTQDVSRAKDNRTFQQSPLLRIDHEDPSMHYIGEGLPKPGETEATWAGRETHVGFSPIPARADHSHDTFLEFGAYGETVSGQVCNPGNTNLLQDHIGGNNYLVTGSLFVLPQEGIWLISSTIECLRSGGGIFQGQANLIHFYLNGTFGREVNRQGTNGPNDLNFNRTITAVDFVFYGTGNIGVNATLELQYQHSDVTTHLVTIKQLTIIRLADN